MPTNLEPIEESDLNTQEKFLGGKSDQSTANVEQPAVPEQSLERKEGQAERDDTYTKILSQVTTHVPAVNDDDIPHDAHSITKEQDAENKIKNLVNLAQMKGVTHAVKVARHLEDNYTLDEFHDRLLAEELHKALVRKGLITEI